MRISGVTVVSRKKDNKKHFVLYVLIFIVLLLLAIFLVSVYAGFKITHPEKKQLPSLSANVAHGIEEIYFYDSLESVRLNGWYIESPNSYKTIIMAHSYGKNRLQFDEKTFEMINNFIVEKYNILLFDFRYSGESEGSYCTFGLDEKNDVLGAVNYAKAKGAEEIILIGFSSGAVAGILAAEESDDIDMLILDSPYQNPGNYVSKLTGLPQTPFKWTILKTMKILPGIDLEKELNIETSIKSVANKPILIIHGVDDKKIDVLASRDLFNACIKTSGNDVELWEIEGVSHLGGYTKNSQKYTKKILEFLKSN